MKNVLLKSLMCVGIVQCMVGCSAGDTAKESNTNATELTGNTEENSINTPESDLQTEVENEIESSQTEDATEPDAETSDEVIGEDTTTENSDAEDAEAESIPEEPEVEMVDFETWAKQEGNEDCCLVVWNEAMKTQKILDPRKEYVVQEGDRFAVPYRENFAVDIYVGENVGKDLMWDSLDYTELYLHEDENVIVCILDYNKNYMTSYHLINE